MIQQLRQTEEQRDNILSELENCQAQLRGRVDEQLERQNLHLREMEQGFERRIKEKEEREANLIRQLRKTEQRRDDIQRELGNCQEQLRERDLTEANLLQQLREKAQQEKNLEQQVTNCQEQLEEKDLREASLHEQLREKEQQQENSQRERTEMEQWLTNCERQLRVKEQEVNALELNQRRQETCDWAILRDEIHMTDKVLGRGGWGSVYEGTYCGCTVAVKQIHDSIVSAYNRRLFEREMNIASRCRHPCLLQFIGATIDEESPLFVTELMETSLRALLEQRELSETEIRVISLDVACALNYLHQKKPSPIIHRDVSSANVLLWRHGDQWRAKVSDYGTANFTQQTMTVAPGAFIYSAREALTSSQTPMVSTIY